jgi:hypothetical protein
VVKDAGKGALQKGHTCSLTRTCRVHEGQGASGEAMASSGTRLRRRVNAGGR